MLCPSHAIGKMCGQHIITLSRLWLCHTGISLLEQLEKRSWNNLSTNHLLWPIKIPITFLAIVQTLQENCFWNVSWDVITMATRNHTLPETLIWNIVFKFFWRRVPLNCQIFWEFWFLIFQLNSDVTGRLLPISVLFSGGENSTEIYRPWKGKRRKSCVILSAGIIVTWCLPNKKLPAEETF